MVPYYGDYPEDHTKVVIPFNAFTSNDPSASATITNFANTDIHIHKEVCVAPRNNASGITVSIDHDGITGNHAVTIDTSDNAVADFYVTGKEYEVRIEGTTIDGAAINAWIGAFSIERVGGVIALLKLIQAAVITNAAGVDVAADIIAVKTETAAIVNDTDVIDDATSGLVKIASDVAATLVDTGTTIPGTITTAQSDLDIITGASGVVIQDGSIVAASLGADCVNSAKIADNAIAAEHLAAAAIDNATFAADVGSTAHATNIISQAARKGLNDYDPPTRAELTTDKNSIITEVDANETKIDTIDTVVDGIQTDLSNATDGLGALKALIDTVDGVVDTILIDTNELQTDWVNAGRLDAILDSILAMLDNARGEPGQGNPPVSPDAMTKLDYLYKSWRNKKTNDGTTRKIYNDAGAVVDQKSGVSEAAGTVTVDEMISGP